MSGFNFTLHDDSSDVDMSNPFYGAIITIIMVVGVLANILTIIVFVKTSHIRNVATSFIISLSAADLSFCLLLVPFTALRYFGVIWYHDKFLCTFTPAQGYGNIIISAFSIALVTINRYVKIAHFELHDRIYQRKYICAMIAFCWLLSYSIQLPTLFGVWGKFGYDPTTQKCDILTDEKGRSSKTVITTIGFIVPCVAIIVCYAGILYVVHKSEQRVRKHAGTRDAEAKRKRRELKRTKMAFIIFISFVLCFLPVTIFHSSDKLLEYHSLYAVSYMILYISTCINPFIYVIMNVHYRKAYVTVLQNMFPCCLRGSVDQIFMLDDLTQQSSDREKSEDNV